MGQAALICTDGKPTGMHRRAAKVNFVEIQSYWHVFRRFDRMWSFFILFLQAVIIVAWNGDGNPTSIFESDVFKKVLSVFITASILKLGQGMLITNSLISLHLIITYFNSGKEY
ncbi:putative 1,3-beta-glucan synthase [Helianthus annuus]|nr:putative 1,3-beta-glucan synthase [Helianthus annuus]